MHKKILQRSLALSLAVLCAMVIPANVEASTVSKATAAEENATEIVPERAYRVFGQTRYETALKAANQLKESLGVKKFDTIIIASGTNFADALAGSYLANVKSAPILMTDGKNIDQLKDYISKNLQSDGKIYILGGNAAVPETVETALKKNWSNVERIWGNDRYETNIKILETAGAKNQDFLVCTGKNFADSLSASAIGKPILLVDKFLTEDQAAFLKKSSVGQIYIIGGEQAVNAEVEAAVEKYDVDGSIDRVQGATRYETSVKVAETFFETPDYAVIAYAENFPDGLCGGPIAYSQDAPLILSATDREDTAAAYTNKLGVGHGIVLGGSGLISDRAAKKIFAKTASTQTATTQYTLKVSTTLRTGASKDTSAVIIPYMTKVEYLGKVSATSSWSKVRYDGQIYYLWQDAGEEYLTSQKRSFQYVSDNQMQQEVISKALYIYNNWDTKYAHNQSNGIKDIDGKYGFDCSGFASYVLDSVMKEYVPTYDVSAHLETFYTTTGVYNEGLKGAFKVQTIQTDTLDESALQPGDILFFMVGNEEPAEGLSYNHCGIYLGDGEFIHATSTWDGVCIMPLADIYKDGFVAAKRYMPDAVTSADVTRYTTSQKTSVYETENSDADPIIILKANEPVKMKFTDNGNWAYVEYDTGKYGYILTKYLTDSIVEESVQMYAVINGLKLYLEPVAGSEYITVSKKTAVEYKGRYNEKSNYHKVVYNGEAYYVYAKDGLDSRLTADLSTLN